MDDCNAERQIDAEAILRKVVADFEQLDRTLDLAIDLLQNGKDEVRKDLEALRRAREAARKGAALARSKVGGEQTR
jgi:hypothetical protein